MVPGRLPVFAMAALILAAGSGAAAPLSRVIAPEAGNSACFVRDYDAAHLRRHARQTAQSITVSLKFDESEAAPVGRIMLRQRGQGAPLQIVGSCSFAPRANRDLQGNRLIRTFPKEAAHDCIAIRSPSSAEEGGYFLVDLAADGRSLTLHLDHEISGWRGAQAGLAQQIRLGRADRVFRLRRTAAGICAAMERELKGP